MSDQSRRSFLKRASVGAAAVGAATIVPTIAATSAGAAEPAGPTHDGPFSVWVKDPKSGTIAVLVGETEVVHRDPALARTLAKIAARGTTA